MTPIVIDKYQRARIVAALLQAYVDMMHAAALASDADRPHLEVLGQTIMQAMTDVLDNL